MSEEKKPVRLWREDRARQRSKKSLLREILEWGLCLAAALAISLIIRTYIGEPVEVKGDSMVPTLLTGERVITGKINYLIGEPQRGDIAVVHYPGSEHLYIKRVIGIGGDRISIDGGVLYLNGEPQQEDYIREAMAYSMQEVLVPEGMVFVMGDNRNWSKDSHMSSVGNIPLEQVVGKAMWRVWPLNKLGSVYTD